MSENVEALKKLREPFPDNCISLLPKPYKKESPKGRCNECGGYHGLPAVHLKYVGHAALTDRLLDVDPAWSWEPVSFDSNTGLPMLDSLGGLWIRLTVCGITRLGYGDAPGKKGGDAIKECIGDALRNAAMRFGAALDLWHKGDLHVDDDDNQDGGGQQPQQPKPQPQKQQPQNGQQAQVPPPPSGSVDTSRPAHDKIMGWIEAVAGKVDTGQKLADWFLNDDNQTLVAEKTKLNATDLSAINRHFEATRAMLDQKGAQQ